MAAVAVPQVILFIGAAEGASCAGDSRKFAVTMPVELVGLCFLIDTVGFPVTTTIALVAAHAVTRSVVAPILLVLGLCVFLWL